MARGRSSQAGSTHGAPSSLQRGGHHLTHQQQQSRCPGSGQAAAGVLSLPTGREHPKTTWHSWKAASPSVQLEALGKCQEPQVCTAVGAEMRLVVPSSGALAEARCHRGSNSKSSEMKLMRKKRGSNEA